MNFKRFNWSRKYLLAAILALIGAVGFSQQRQVDSLNLLMATASDSGKIKILNELSWIYKNSSVDSAILYARRSLKLAKQGGNNRLIASAFNSLGSALQASGNYDSALFYLNESVH